MSFSLVDVRRLRRFTWAMGCPKLDVVTLWRSGFMQAAMTIMIIRPKSQQAPMEKMIP